MSNIIINTKRNVIEISKSFSKKAFVFNTAEYKDLMEVRHEFPTFRVEVKKSNRKKNSIKGLDYNFIEKYIADHDDEEMSIMKEYEKRRGIDEFGLEINAEENKMSYAQIRAWFLTQFPEIKEYYKARQKNEKVA